MHTKAHDTGVSRRFTNVMVVPCPECGHKLWTEEVRVGDRYYAWACFDDEVGSDTYAEQVRLCPGCTAGLNATMTLRTLEAPTQS